MTLRFLLSLGLLAVILTACTPQASPPTPDMSAALTRAVETALAQLQPSTTPPPSETPIPPPTAIRIPPALPSTFVVSQLNPLDIPHTYIQDTCQYLYDKWNSNNAAPGTVVMVVMFHGIVKDPVAQDPEDITAQDFRKLMDDLKEQGFEAINMKQMADFVDHNSKIPARSVLLISDDRHQGAYFNDHFRPYRDQWGWHVVNGWISFEDGPRALSLEDNIALEAEGWVDHQSHGYIHNINMSNSSTDEFIKTEFEKSIADLQTNFKKTPIAIIWPGGNFGTRPIQFAREYGYRLGFTINPRGPIMYNWIPLADQPDPARPAFLPEGHINDPRMVLPRYWPYDVQQNLDAVRNIGSDAAAYAEQNKATELEYYDIMCASTLGQIP
ncbi:MAG: polysaccharide deacetylase family protein [Anaerolineae bacterium]|nr:polysaccharide deacetylase family protein [Anaerolineae bacterium]MCI0607931.1 polysaccharide deacetylase family protein [Anaerolineae bacterium]